MDLENQKDWVTKLYRAEENLSHVDEIDDVTNDCLLELKSCFHYFVRVFNSLKNQQLGKIYFYEIEDSKTDFMLFRKGCRLVFTKADKGKVCIGFNQKAKDTTDAVDIKAYLQAFSNNALSSVRWLHDDFEGFVDLNSLARYYMKLFVSKSK